MSEKKSNDAPEEAVPHGSTGRRKSPLLPNAILWIGFVLLVVAAVFTVVLPELEDDPAGDAESAQADGEEAAEAAAAAEAAE